MNYSDKALGITGPVVYGEVFSEMHNLETIESHKTEEYMILNTSYLNSDTKNVINMYNNQEIFISWSSRRDYLKEWTTKDYNYLWKTRNVFDKNLHKKYFI